MIERIFDGSGLPFGVLLTPENVESRDAAVRVQRQALLCNAGAARLVLLDGTYEGCKPIEDLAAPSGPN